MDTSMHDMGSPSHTLQIDPPSVNLALASRSRFELVELWSCSFRSLRLLMSLLLGAQAFEVLRVRRWLEAYKSK